MKLNAKQNAHVELLVENVVDALWMYCDFDQGSLDYASDEVLKRLSIFRSYVTRLRYDQCSKLDKELV